MNDKQPDVQVNISLDELKALIQEAVHDALLEVLGEDMNSEPNFSPDIAKRLKKYRTEKPIRIPIDEAVKELGLDA
jgi:hypothetical protein